MHRSLPPLQNRAGTANDLKKRRFGQRFSGAGGSADYRLTRHVLPSILKFWVIVDVLLPLLSLVVFYTVSIAVGPSTTRTPFALMSAAY